MPNNNLKIPTRPIPTRGGGFFDGIQEVARFYNEIRRMYSEIIGIKNQLTEAISKVAQGPEGKPGLPGRAGRDADEQKIIQAVLTRIKLPRDGRDADPARVADLVIKMIGVPRDGKSVSIEDVLEELKKKKIKTEHVDGLEQTISAVRNASMRLGGGGGSQIKTLTGTVDGSNTSFTSDGKPAYIIIDGVSKIEGVHYTYASDVITITDGAPPVQFIRAVH